MKKQIPLFLTLILGLGISSLAQGEQFNGKSSKITAEFWQQQMAKALEKRNQPTGEKPPGLFIPKELTDINSKERQKIKAMADEGFVQPLDFSDLAEKRMNGDLVGLPVATETYIVDVGGSADDSEFNSFSFEDGSTPLSPDSPKFAVLKKLADDFDGENYDLDNPQNRVQMKIRLLRMISPEAQKIIEEIAGSYQKKFNRPLRITSLVRSIEYQKDQNAVNPNSFLVKDNTSKPPHASGYAFDIARKRLTAEEQNFIMQQLSTMEANGKVDASIEYGVNAAFHIFVL